MGVTFRRLSKVAQRVIFATMRVKITQSMAYISKEIRTLTGTPCPGPPALRVVASMVLNLRKVKNMTVVFCRTLEKLHLFSMFAPVGTQGAQPLAPTHP